MKRNTTIGIFFAALVFALIAWWLAAGVLDHPEYGGEPITDSAVRDLLAAGNKSLSLEQILAGLEGLPEGSRLLEVERYANAGQTLLEFEFVTREGRILEWWVDPVTGEVLSEGVEH